VSSTLRLALRQLLAPVLPDVYVILGADGVARVERELGRVHAAVRASEAAAPLRSSPRSGRPGFLAQVMKLQWSLTHQYLLD
jgi:hypothetical protein